MVLHVAAMVAAVIAIGLAGGVDLAKKYPATLDHVDAPLAHEWTVAAEDVWAVSGVKLGWELNGKKLAVEFGPANVVLGHAQKNVLWAVVLPQKPGKLATSLPGDGGVVYNAWLRFHPSLVGELFPAATVLKNGPDNALIWARRIATLKINANWQSDNLPIVPWKHSISVDLHVQGQTRRYYAIDTKASKILYEAAFEKRCLPIAAPIVKADALAAFDEVAGAFDKEYAKFGLHPDYDWGKAVTALRKRAGASSTAYEVGACLAELLRPLDDLHIDVSVDGEWIPCATRVRPRNGSWNAVSQKLVDVIDAKNDVFSGRVPGGIGYVNVFKLEDQELPRAFDEALEKLADTYALIVDLRFNGGGDELLAQQVAGRFLDQERVYSVNRYRSGPKRDQFGAWLERKAAPRGSWRYESPVLVLQGQRTMSSAESLALMLAQCPQVTTMGDKTAGSSANPRIVETKGKITVRLPRWDDRDPQKNVIEGKGIAPEVAVPVQQELLTDANDPVFTKAVETLRAIPEAARLPGKRK